MTIDMGEHCKCGICDKRKCDCPERQSGSWNENNLETETANDFYRPSEEYREARRVTPLKHIETEAKNSFFAPIKKAITAYRERLETRYQDLSLSRRNMWTQYTLILVISASLTVAQAHA